MTKNSKLKTRIKPSKSNPVLKQVDIIRCLQALQKKFVLFPIDKASNNVAYIRKRYYVEVILNEIAVIGHGNTTYRRASESRDEIIEENTKYTRRLGCKITEKEKTLPIMYWIRKMHKNPIGARFIIAFKYALQNKFLNLFPMSLTSYALKLKIFMKMISSYLIITSFESYKILTSSFKH